jgi:hypothetical protein
MINIFLRASELAKLTGHNTYQPKKQTINEILSRNNIKDIYIPKSNIEEQLLQLSNEKLSTLKQELQLDNSSTIQAIESHIKSNIMNSSYTKNISEAESKKLIDTKCENNTILQSISSGIKNDLQMRRGNIKEDSNLNKIQDKKNIKIDQRNSKMYTKELLRTDKYIIMIRGKVDGVSDGMLIETKNRTNRLFKTLRDYEKVQLETYMFLTGINHSLLTEHYNDESFEISYSHDEEFWNDCIKKTTDFINMNIAPFISN